MEWSVPSFFRAKFRNESKVAVKHIEAFLREDYKEEALTMLLVEHQELEKLITGLVK